MRNPPHKLESGMNQNVSVQTHMSRLSCFRIATNQLWESSSQLSRWFVLENCRYLHTAAGLNVMCDIPKLFVGSRLTQNCGGRNSGWLQRNRLICDTFCTTITEDPNLAESGFLKVNSDRIAGILTANSILITWLRTNLPDVGTIAKFKTPNKALECHM